MAIVAHVPSNDWKQHGAVTMIRRTMAMVGLIKRSGVIPRPDDWKQELTLASDERQLVARSLSWHLELYTASWVRCSVEGVPCVAQS